MRINYFPLFLSIFVVFVFLGCNEIREKKYKLINLLEENPDYYSVSLYNGDNLVAFFTLEDENLSKDLLGNISFSSIEIKAVKGIRDVGYGVGWESSKKILLIPVDDFSLITHWKEKRFLGSLKIGDKLFLFTRSSIFIFDFENWDISHFADFEEREKFRPASFGDKIVIFGGERNGKTINSAEIIGRERKIINFDGKSDYKVLYLNNYPIFIGGVRDGKILGDCTIFLGDRFQNFDCIEPREKFDVTVIEEREDFLKFIVTGGIDPNGKILGAEMVEIKKSSQFYVQREKYDMVIPRYGHKSVKYGSYVIVFGGAGYVDGVLKEVKDSEIFYKDRFSKFTEILYPRLDFSVLKIGFFIFLLGGKKLSGEPVYEVERFFGSRLEKFSYISFPEMYEDCFTYFYFYILGYCSFPQALPIMKTSVVDVDI